MKKNQTLLPSELKKKKIESKSLKIQRDVTIERVSQQIINASPLIDIPSEKALNNNDKKVLTTFQQRIKDLETNEVSLNTQIKSLNQSLGVGEANYKQLAGDLAIAKSKKKTRKLAVKDLEIRLDTARRNIEILDEDKENLLRLKTDLETRVRDLIKDLADDTTSRLETEKKLNDLETLFLRSETEYEKNLKAGQQQIDDLVNNVAQLKNLYDTTDKELAKAKQEIQVLENNLENTKQTYQFQVDTLKDNVNTLTAEKDRANAEIKSNLTQITNLTSQVSALELDKVKNQATIDTLNLQLTNIKDELVKKSQELVDSQDRLNKKTTELANKESEFRRQVDSLQKDIDTKQKEIDDKEKDIDSLKDNASELKNDVRQQRDMARTAMNQRAELEERERNLKEEIKQLNVNLDSLNKKILSGNITDASLRQEVSKYQSDLAQKIKELASANEIVKERNSLIKRTLQSYVANTICGLTTSDMYQYIPFPDNNGMWNLRSYFLIVGKIKKGFFNGGQIHGEPYWQDIQIKRCWSYANNRIHPDLNDNNFIETTRNITSFQQWKQWFKDNQPSIANECYLLLDVELKDFYNALDRLNVAIKQIDKTQSPLKKQKALDLRNRMVGRDKTFGWKSLIDEARQFWQNDQFVNSWNNDVKREENALSSKYPNIFPAGSWSEVKVDFVGSTPIYLTPEINKPLNPKTQHDLVIGKYILDEIQKPE